MEENYQLWPLAKEVLRALGQHYYPVMEGRAGEAGMGECDWYLLLPALTFDPEPISSAKLLVRVPFYAPHIYENRLQRLSELGYLKATAPDKNGGEYPRYEYNLTESGRMTIQWIIQSADVAMAGMHPLPLDESESAAELLHRIVLAAVETPEPPEKWALSHSRRTDHSLVAPVVVRIDQYLTDLNAYRDDCHLAAWQQHVETQDVTPPAWEVLTQLWKADAVKEGAGYTLEELAQMLERRGHSRQVYSDGLKSLVSLGWVHADKKVYRVTVLGQTARQMAEFRTDQYFYVPWRTLEASELSDLKEMLVRMWDGLRLRLTANNH